MRLILLLVVLFGCFYMNEAKHTLYVANIYPNFGDYIVINDLAVDDFTIGLLNVGTLNVESAEGVEIGTSSSISLKGASISLGGSAVSVSTTSPNSTVNINAAATFDVSGTSATFSSVDGGVLFNALTNFELISTGDLSGDYSGHYAFQGTYVNFQSSKGGSHFLTHSDFNSQATTTSVESGNMIRFATSSFQVEANLAIDLFSNDFEAEVNTFTLTAQRNNILIQTGTLLDIGGEYVNVNARDLFTVSSLESQVLISSGSNGMYNALNSFTINSDSEVTFRAINSDLSIGADAIYMYGDEGVAVQSTSLGTFSLKSSDMTAIGRSVVVQTTNTEISHTSGMYISNSFTRTTIETHANLALFSMDDLSIEGDAGIKLYAERGTLNLANSPTLATDALIKFNSNFSTVLSGTLVSALTNHIELTSNNNLRFATTEEDQDVTLNVAMTSDFTSLGSKLLLISGGEVDMYSNTLSIDGASDVIFNAADLSTGAIIFNTFNQSEKATTDISYYTGQFTLQSQDSVTFGAGASLTVHSENDQLYGLTKNMNFNILSNMTIDTTLNALYLSMDSINVGDTILSQLQINSGYADILSSGRIFNKVSGNVTVIGTNINFDADANLILQVNDTMNAAALRFTIISGSQSYTKYSTITFNSTDTLFQSPPNQNIIVDAQKTITVTGDTTLGARKILSSGDLFSLSSGTSVTIETNQQDPISISSQGDISFSSQNNLYAVTDQDMIFSVDGDFSNNANSLSSNSLNGDILRSADTFSFTSESTLDLFGSHSYTSYSKGDTIIVSGNQDIGATYVKYHSRGGDNDFQVTQDISFTGKSSSQEMEIEATNSNSFSSLQTTNLKSTNIQINTGNGELDLESKNDLKYAANNDFVFYGDEFDISALGSLSINTNKQLTIASSTINFDSDQALQITANGGVSLLAGLDKDLTLTQKSATGDFTIMSNNLLIRSNNELNVQAKSFSHTSTNNNEAILLQSSAMSAGILIDSKTFIGTVTDNVLFVVDDVTNRGGGDINIKSTGSVEFLVDTDEITGNAVNPVPLLQNTINTGILLQAAGSEFDARLGYHVGMLFRADGLRSKDGGISITSNENDVYFNARTYNDHISEDNSISINTNLDATFDVGADMSIESQHGNFAMTTEAGNIDISVGQTTRIQTFGQTKLNAKENLLMSAGNNIEIIADNGAVEFQFKGQPSDVLSTTSTSFNLEGAGKGSYTYGSDSYQAQNVDIFAYSSLGVLSDADQSITAGRNIYYESSVNNDILVQTKTTSSNQADGSIILNAGGAHVFDSTEGFTLKATNDVTFYSAGSFQFVATDTLTFNSVTNQIYTGVQHVYFESLGSVNIGSTTNNPIINFYAGGSSLRAGVDLTSSGNIGFTSKNDNSISARNLLTIASGDSTITAVGSITLQSTGTNGIGKDVYLKAAESLDFDASGNIILNAKTLKFEYTDLDFTISSDIILSAAKAISISGSKFSTQSNIHTLNPKTGLSMISSGDALFTAGTALSFVAKSTANWQSLSQMQFTSSEIDFTSLGTNSPITFQTKNDRSFIYLQSDADISYTAGDNIDIRTSDAFRSFAKGTIQFSIGDSVTTSSGGSVIFSGVDETFEGSDPTSVGSEVEFTSTGTMEAKIGQSVTMKSTNDQIFIEADLDITFTGAPESPPSNTEITGTFAKIDLTTGNDFYFHTAETLFVANSYDTVSFGLNPENGDGIRIGTSGKYSDIVVDAVTGSLQVSAIGNIDLLSDNAVTMTSAGMIQLLSKGGEGILFHTVDLPTPIQLVSHHMLEFSAQDIVTMSSFGFDPASGYIDIHAAGYKNLGEANPIINGTYGIGFFANNTEILMTADDAAVRIEDLHHFFATPSVNGTLLLQSHGQNRQGVGINIESTIIKVVSELNVAMEAANIHFFDYGISLYFYHQEIFKPNLINLNRPTIHSSKDQTYVAYGHNKKGNAIELISSVPNAPIELDAGFVNFYSGGSLRVEGEISQHYYTQYNSYISSATSVVIEGLGFDADYGVYLTTKYDPDPVFDIGQNIEFLAGTDAYIGAAQRIISNAALDISFVTGTAGNIDMTFNDGAIFQSTSGGLQIATNQDLDIISKSDMKINTGRFTATSYRNVVLQGSGIADGSSDVVFGDPSLSGGSITFTGRNLLLYAANVDIANTADLEIPYVARPLTCNSDTLNLVYITTVPNGDYRYDMICSCIAGLEGTHPIPLPNDGPYRLACFTFIDSDFPDEAY